MNVVTVFLLSLAAFAVGLPVENNVEIDTAGIRNSAVEQVILDILEDVREIMINGNDDVPVLDPLQAGDVRLQLDDFGIVNSHVEAISSVVTGLSTFVVDDLSARLSIVFPIVLQRYTITVDAHIPELIVNADNYDLSVTVLGLTVFGNGLVDIKMIEPRLKMTLVINIQLIGGNNLLSMHSADVKIGMTAFQSALTGIFHDDYLNDFINLFLGELIPQSLEFFEEDISQFLNEQVIVIGNQILENINIGDLLPQIAEIAGLPVENEIQQEKY